MLFEHIYRLFVSLFGADLADYLSGYICPSDNSEGGYIDSNQFIKYGLIALGIALGVAVVYYYVINHPRFNSWWHWLLMMISVGVINFFVGALMTLSDYNNGLIGECLLSGGSGGIFESNCWMFGLSNLFVSSVFFIIVSFAIKWGSTNAKRSPF